MSRSIDQYGNVLQFSPSSLELADTRDSGCMRKWWYRYVMHLRQPETDEMRRGTFMHAFLQRFVESGILPPNPSTIADPVVRLACEMAHKVIAAGIAPTPGPDVLCEQRIDTWGLTAAGVRVVGVIDYLHGRRTNNGVLDITDMHNPPNTIVIGDYKSKNSKRNVEATTKYLQTPETLTRSIQMATYGIAASRRFGQSTIRLEHCYAFDGAPGPRKVTRLAMVDDLLPTWEYAEALARGCIDAAKEKDVNKVDANRFACDRFGPKYLCMHAPYCTGYRNNDSLAMIFGETTAKDMTMSLMQSVPTNPGTSGFNLAAEEQALRAQQGAVAAGVAPVATQAANTGAIDDATFAEAWRAIIAANQGTPALGYPAACIYARVCNSPPPPPQTGYAGTGPLGVVNAYDVVAVLQIAADFGFRRAAPVQPQMPAAMPQALPAMPGQQPAPQMQTMPPAQPAPYQMPAPSILAPEAPASNPALAARPLEPTPAAPVAQIGVIGNATAEAPPAKRPRGRPRKAVTTTTAALASAEATEELGGYTLEIFIECDVAGGADSLDEYIDRTVGELVARFCPPPSIPDLRAAPNDGPIGYGKWKAAIAATVRQVPPAPGRYLLHVGTDEIRAEFANALRGVCAATTGLFVDGR